MRTHRDSTVGCRWQWAQRLYPMSPGARMAGMAPEEVLLRGGTFGSALTSLGQHSGKVNMRWEQLDLLKSGDHTAHYKVPSMSGLLTHRLWLLGPAHHLTVLPNPTKATKWQWLLSWVCGVCVLLGTFLNFWLIFIISCIWVFCLHVHLCATFMPGTQGDSETPCGCWELNPDPLQ